MNVTSVIWLGKQEYADALETQRRLVELRKHERIGDVLLLLEHAPVITLGRNAKKENVIASPQHLAERGVHLYECDRGGDVTFHGPGQLVGYPICDLRAMPAADGKRNSMGAIEYVRNLEEALIRTCTGFGIPTKRICGLTGVWTANGEEAAPACSPSTSLRANNVFSPGRPNTEAKVAAIGVHISRGVTSHGFALNVNTDLSCFDLIVPCGIATKPVTSMQKELGREILLEAVAESVSRNFGFVFNKQMLWLESIDDLRPAPADLPLKVPESLRKLRGEAETFQA